MLIYTYSIYLEVSYKENLFIKDLQGPPESFGLTVVRYIHCTFCNNIYVRELILVRYKHEFVISLYFIVSPAKHSGT